MSYGGAAMAKNYYSILNVAPTATLEEIRSAYRTRAKQYHPDHFGRDSAPFLNVQEAYGVLSNPISRRSYDRGLREQEEIKVTRVGPGPEALGSRRPPAEPLKGTHGWPQPETISPFRSFRTFRPSIGEMLEGLWDAFDLRLQPKAERLRTLTLEMVLTPEQARWGGRLRTLVPIGVRCPACGGAAAAGFFECWQCGGNGFSQGEYPLELEYPPGIRDSCKVAVPLDRLGLHDVCLIVHFRVGGESGFGDV
jgi:DnaJ-class molecular chaperone